MLLWSAFFLRVAAQTPEADSEFLRVDTLILPDERVVCLGVGNGTPVSIRWQSQSNGVWTGWQTLPGEAKFKDVRGLILQDKKLSVFAISRDGKIWFNRQAGSENDWAGWKPMGAVIGFTRIAPVSTSDGKLICFAIGDGLVWMNEQSLIEGRWNGWKRLPGVSGIGHLRSFARPDGKMEIYAIGLRSGSWLAERAASGQWSQWKSNPELPPFNRARTREGPAMFFESGPGSLVIYRWASTGSAFSMLATNGHPKGYSLSSIGNRMVAADVNGDGRTDNVVAYQYPDSIMRLHVYLNGSAYQTPRGWFQRDAFKTSTVGERMEGGDFNGDGNGDIVMFSDTGHGLSVFRFLSTGSSFVSDVTKLADYDLSKIGEHIAATDANGDGRTDVIAAQQQADGTVRLHVFTNGNSFAGENGWLQSGPLDLAKVAGRMIGGDFDGNGKGDVAMYYDTGDGVKIYRFLSTGKSFVADATSIPSGYDLSRVGSRVAAGDVNGDGMTDAVTAYQYPNEGMRLHVFLNGNSYGGSEGWFQSNQFDLGKVEGRFTMGQWQTELNLSSSRASK